MGELDEEAIHRLSMIRCVIYITTISFRMPARNYRGAAESVARTDPRNRGHCRRRLYRSRLQAHAAGHPASLNRRSNRQPGAAAGNVYAVRARLRRRPGRRLFERVRGRSRAPRRAEQVPEWILTSSAKLPGVRFARTTLLDSAGMGILLALVPLGMKHRVKFFVAAPNEGS